MNKRIVFIGNCDAMGSTHPSGAYADKARFKSYRWINYADYADDIVIIHLPLPPDYQSLRRTHFGFCPQVYCPINDPEPLDLARAVLEDFRLLEQIQRHINTNKNYSFSLYAVVNTEEIFKIGERLQIPIAEPGIEQIESGLRDDLNNKIKFIERFAKLGYETPHGIVVSGKDQLMEAVSKFLRLHRKVMIRKPNEADEKGNLPLVGKTEEEAMEILSSLPADWLETPLLVEPFLDLQDSPCTLGKMHKDGTVELLHTGTQVFAKSAYCWISPPNYPQSVIDEMETKLSEYMKEIAKKGAIGWVDIDWGRTNENKIIGIESNYRMTGWTPAAMLMRRMFPDGGNVHLTA